MNKRIIILGGGTFQPITNHFSLSAPAFGTTARKLNKLISNSELVLTKMANYESNLLSNRDVESFIDNLLEDKTVSSIILNVAFCDFEYPNGGFHNERLKTSDGDITLTFTPSVKIISKIRKKRPDIFLVGFKTTTNKTVDEQFLIGLKMMKSTKCNLVLANDTITRNNIIITPEETYYSNTIDRDKALNELIEIFQLRLNATYNRTNFIENKNVSIDNTSETFRTVLKFLIDNGGFIENNGNGFTPGHFCQRMSKKEFISSQRKANHNNVFENGLSLVSVDETDVFNPKFTVNGDKKASVGANILFKKDENPERIIEFIKDNIELGIKVI